MFGEKTEESGLKNTTSTFNSSTSTLIDEQASFEGKMTFEGTVQINGKFNGEIFSSGNLIIGESGKVEGEINIGEIEIKGQVRGNIKAKKRIEINSPAQVYGDISSPSIVVKEGAIFEGSCSMGKENVVSLGSHKNEVNEK